MEYSPKGRFCYKQGAHGVVCTMVHSFQIGAWHVALSSSVRQHPFQGIDIDPVTDPSLKSIKGNLHP